MLFGTLAWGALTLLTALSVALFGAVFPWSADPAGPLLTALGAAARVDGDRLAPRDSGRSVDSPGVPSASRRSRTGSRSPGRDRGRVRRHVRRRVRGGLARGGGRARTTARAATGVRRGSPRPPPSLRSSSRSPWPRGDRIDVAAIQVDFSEAVQHATREEGDIAVTRLNLDLHRTLEDAPPDLAVWGESALDPGSLAILDEVRCDDRRRGGAGPRRSHLGGHPLDAPERRAAVQPGRRLRRRGRGGRTSIGRPISFPYGEYIPWKPVVGWISALEQIAYELTPGERLHTLSAPGLPRFGAPICFENSFPALDP